MKLKCNKVKPPLAGVITAEYLKSSQKIDIEWCNETMVENASNKVTCATSNEVCRTLARLLSEKDLFGANAQEKTEVDHWMTFSIGPLNTKNEFPKAISYLNQCLGPVTYLVGKRLTIADFSVFAALYASKEWQLLTGKQEVPSHIQRWYSLISSNEAVVRTLNNLPEEAKTALTPVASTRANSADKSIVGQRNQEGKFVDLPGAEMGKVVVRFPPEASGYLHIGHAKAALLNQYYQQAFDGKLIMRFDDTNPAKENVHFEKVILEDIEMLNIKPDLFTHTSNYFDLMIEYCERMIKEGKAYVDDTEPELMKQQREQKIESENRKNSPEKNFALWEEMKKGTDKGLKCCVRAKIDMQSPNGCMRDPTIYRCKNEVHPRTGTKYKVYPTYDFACPIVDAIENVTHTLRTMEYHDRDAQFYWFIEALGLRRPYIWEYSRLSMTNTVLSKRKLTWFVQNHHVDGWDDPRFPTVRGVLRRGMTVEGLKQFIIAQGSSRSVVFMEWDKIWSFNKKVIDPIAPRYTAVNCEHYVPVLVKGIDKPEVLTVPLHPKNADVGTKQVWVGPKILIDYEDAECLKEGENTTFINWGNLMINKINRDKNNLITSVEAQTNLDNKDYKKTLKLTWLCDTEKSPNIACYIVFFDHIISKPLLGKDEDFKQYIGHQTRFEFKMLGDPEMKKLKVGDIIQLQRRGFFRVDVAYEGFSNTLNKELLLILFHIPDGHAKENPMPKYQFEEPARTPYNIYNDIKTWNEKLSKLESSKASKEQIEEAQKKLYLYKEEFNVKTGVQWIPQLPSPPEEPKKSIGPNSTQKSATSDFVKAQIDAQEKLLKYLKVHKSNSAVLDEEQKRLDDLKKSLEKAPIEAQKATAKSGATPALDVNGILEKIAAQGDKIRELKGKKAEKSVIDPEVKVLLSLKEDYKKLTGQDWKPGATAPKSAEKPSSGSSEQDILDKIAAQGEKVRKLKAEKAEKPVVDGEVKVLIALKEDYKKLTGKEWKPGTVATPITLPKPTESSSEVDILNKIAAQGEKVRKLKSEKAEKSVVDTEVKVLLSLKEDYKKLTGKEWKPGTVATPSTQSKPADSSSEADILDKIAAQGEKVRKLKAEKAEKSTVDAEVKLLLALKEDYKKLTGKEWKPGTTASKPSAPSLNTSVANVSLNEAEILEKISAQGDKVRKLKSEKADKATVDAEVKTLLALKTDYKNLTGNEWKPGTVAKTPALVISSPPIAAMGDSGSDATQLTNKINEQGNIVRNLKSAKAPKEEVDAAVKILLDMKTEYKNLTGTDFPVAGRPPSKPKDSKPKEVKETKVKQQAAKKNEKKPVDVDDSNIKKQTRLGLEAKKEENLSDWYSQVITKGEMIEYYDVSGCYIFRPWSFSIWEAIKDWFDGEIKKLGVQNCYFPIFVSKSVLEKEKTHIADFAPEVAWVTKSGDSEMAEPIAVRPTSETVMYPAYAKWVQSYRDLPIKLNQWNNVVRWEFKHPQPFLRTREFLWQEGHTAYANKEEADVEVKTILDLYAKIYTDLLAIPVVKGRKTEKEKFAGGDYTYTVEAFVSASGRGIQGATSHHLGQNFSKMFDITFEDPDTQEKKYVFQNSWGITTRTIGVMIMIHADNQGLILPPKVASIQIVIVPCGLTVSLSDADKHALQDACDKLEKNLLSVGIKVKGDYRSNYSPGWKFNHWELKGVPIRIEYGPKDLKNKQIVAVRRDTGEKVTIKIENAVKELGDLLEKIQKNLYDRASNDLNTHMVTLKDWSQFGANLDKKNIILAPFCGDISCEDKIKADSARDDAEAEPGAPAMGAKSLCIPLEQPQEIKPDDKCIHPNCQRKAKYYTLFGRSY